MGMEEEGEGENKEGQWRGLGEAFLDVVVCFFFVIVFGCCFSIAAIFSHSFP